MSVCTEFHADGKLSSEVNFRKGGVATDMGPLKFTWRIYALSGHLVFIKNSCFVYLLHLSQHCCKVHVAYVCL